jgi:hypothetical protein
MADPDYDDDELFADLYADDAPPAQAKAPTPDVGVATEVTAQIADNEVALKSNEDNTASFDASANGIDTWDGGNENGHHIDSQEMIREDSRADNEDIPIGIKEDG